jgi:hypothetical protein
MTSPEMGYVALTQYTDPAVTILTTYFCPFFHGISCLLGTQAPSIRIRLSLQGRPNLTFTKQSLEDVFSETRLRISLFQRPLRMHYLATS